MEQQSNNPQAVPAEDSEGTRRENLARMQAEAREARRRRNQPFDPYDEDEIYDGERRRPSRRFRRLRRKLICWLVVLLLIVAAVLLVWPRVRSRFSGLFTPSFAIEIPESLDSLLPDDTMGYAAVDFSNAILGESREKQSLVVMEQDGEVTSQISQSLLNIPLFSMAKLIHSYGTGVYTVELADLTEEDVDVDMATGIITVAVPHAKLAYITIDAEKTEIEDTKKAILAIGDIKMTQEQQAVLDQSVDAALTQQLSMPAVLTKADEVALIKVRELFQPLVSAISKDYIVKVVMV